MSWEVSHEGQTSLKVSWRHSVLGKSSQNLMSCQSCPAESSGGKGKPRTQQALHKLKPWGSEAARGTQSNVRTATPQEEMRGQPAPLQSHMYVTFRHVIRREKLMYFVPPV